MNNGFRRELIGSAVHDGLMKTDPGYHDLSTMMEIKPLAVTVLPSGAFQNYYLRKQENGAELAQSKPPKMNASDNVIRELASTVGKETASVKEQ